MGINTFAFRQSEGLNYTVLETTVQEQLSTLVSGDSPPQVREASVPNVDSLPLVGPLAGHFHHDTTDDGRIGLVWTGVHSLKNISAEAWFRNPYSGQNHDFSYGFIVRSNPNDPSFQFYVTSTGEWVIRKRGINTSVVVARGVDNNLNTGAYEKNHLSVRVFGNYGAFLLNDQALAGPDGDTVIQLGTDTSAGRVLIGNGFIIGTEKQGAITHYEELEVDQLTFSVRDISSFKDLLSARGGIHRNLSAPGNEGEHQQED